MRELFHVCYWLAHTYPRGASPPPGWRSTPTQLPEAAAPRRKQTVDQLQRLEAGLRERDEKLSALLADQTALDAELTRLREEVAAAKKANTAQPDTHDYSEAETRDYFIDLLLKEAGWPLDQPRDREFEVAGMPNSRGQGLRGLRAVGRRRQAARRWSKPSAPGATPRVGQQQAKLYADCLEQQFGQRPVIFYSNGYEHWLWDDTQLPAPRGAGLLQEGRAGAADPAPHDAASRWPTPHINAAIVERYYQTRAIRRIARGLRAGPPAQGAAGDGDRRGQDPHGHRAGRPADALQLGEARAVPRRPRGAGQPGGQRLQDAPARRVAGEPGDREGRPRAGSSSPPTRR